MTSPASQHTLTNVTIIRALCSEDAAPDRYAALGTMRNQINQYANDLK
jgi:hypothetical protein